MTHPVNDQNASERWFPGRWIGGTALILAPLLLLTGVLLRIQFHFFFPQQLTAYLEHPSLLTAAYSCFLAGNILLWPAVLTLVHLILPARPHLALWGGSLTLLGLFARTFHAGIDHLAFQLARQLGAPLATEQISKSYGAFHIVSSLSIAIVFGWIILAIGAYRSGTLGWVRSIALGLMAALMLGVLKGTSPTSIVATAGLGVAFVPLGLEVLTKPPHPSARDFVLWTLLLILLLTVLFVTGRLG